jgi:two-component sensor histidine kinase
MDALRRIDNMKWLGDGDVAQQIRARNWTDTPLGPPDNWPQCLRTALCISLHSSSPVAVYWGEEFITLYNDVCAELIGDRHPNALGMPAADLFSDIWHSIGPIFRAAMATGESGGSRNQPLPLNRDGHLEELRFDFTATPVHDDAGRIRGIFVYSFDITDHLRTTQNLAAEMSELQRLQARQRVLVVELQHRTRNLLAVVRAIASQSLRGRGHDGALDSFLERLSALGRVQGLIGRADERSVKLSDIVWAELEAYAPASRSRLEVHGPDVRLSAHQVQTIALALHELVTNAVKYGALREAEGRLSVTWETWLAARGGQRLALMWKESGVTVSPEAAARRGHGRELIENSLRFSLHADTQLVFGSDGVWCRIEMQVGPGRALLDPARLHANR